jgi:hypothetical protein
VPGGHPPNQPIGKNEMRRGEYISDPAPSSKRLHPLGCGVEFWNVKVDIFWNRLLF